MSQGPNATQTESAMNDYLREQLPIAAKVARTLCDTLREMTEQIDSNDDDYSPEVRWLLIQSKNDAKDIRKRLHKAGYLCFVEEKSQRRT